MRRILIRRDYRQEKKVRWLLVHRQNNQGAICNKLHQGMFIFKYDLVVSLNSFYVMLR